MSFSESLALLSAESDGVADLLVRGVEDAVVQALKKRAGAHGRSAEAEHRAILAAALLTPPRRPLAALLAAMPDVGCDAGASHFRQNRGQGCLKVPVSLF